MVGDVPAGTLVRTRRVLLVGDAPLFATVAAEPSLTGVDVARRRAAGLDNVEVAVIDAAAIDQPDGSFDVVASRMGLMFVPDPAAALTEATWIPVMRSPPSITTCAGVIAGAAGTPFGVPGSGNRKCTLSVFSSADVTSR